MSSGGLDVRANERRCHLVFNANEEKCACKRARGRAFWKKREEWRKSREVKKSLDFFLG